MEGRRPNLVLLDDNSAELESTWVGNKDHVDVIAAADDAAIVRNENQVEGWRFLLQYSPDVAMKMIAKERLKELDPTNPEWKTAP